MFRWFLRLLLGKPPAAPVQIAVTANRPLQDPDLAVVRSLPDSRSSMMKRGVGYCEVESCEDFAKGVFLLNHGDTFHCPRCRAMGLMVHEVGEVVQLHENAPYKEVRVEFDYEPRENRYKGLAIIRDESVLGQANSYNLRSPLIRTDKRALKVAESILSNLQRYQNDTGNSAIPRTTEVIVSFDDSYEEFSAKLSKLGAEWQKSGERHQNWDRRKKEQ